MCSKSRYLPGVGISGMFKVNASRPLQPVSFNALQYFDSAWTEILENFKMEATRLKLQIQLKIADSTSETLPTLMPLDAL